MTTGFFVPLDPMTVPIRIQWVNWTATAKNLGALEIRLASQGLLKPGTQIIDDDTCLRFVIDIALAHQVASQRLGRQIPRPGEGDLPRVRPDLKPETL